MITQDDVLYMIVTDRFEDGDPANNGEIDRSHPYRRHGGDLLGIVRRLPYLQDLGVTTLWITPVYLNPPHSYHGYHPLDFERVDPHLCSPELGPAGDRSVVRRFVEIVHEHGMKVMLDLVVNHAAWDHPWLKERPDWFNRDQPDLYKGWLWGLPDLNHDNVDVSTYFTRSVLEWVIQTGADAIRLDAARHVETRFWDLFRIFQQGLRPDCTVVGEVWDPDVAAVAPFQEHYGFDSMFDFPLNEAVQRVFLRDESFELIAAKELVPGETPGVLNRDAEYRNAYRLVTFLDNHDTARFYSQALTAGDEAEAERRTRLALAFLFTGRGIPQLFYGAELAMEGGPHPDNRRDMPWDLLADGKTSPEARRALAMRDYVRDLIRLRRASMGLRYGLAVTLYVSPTLYAFARLFPGDPRVVVFNNGDEPADLAVPVGTNPRIPTMLKEELCSGRPLANDLPPHERLTMTEAGLPVRLAPRSAAVYRVETP